MASALPSMKKGVLLSLLVNAVIMLILSSCLGTGAVLSTATPDLAITLAPSPTFVIPSAIPTSTNTPGPTLTPTADLLADAGEILFSDSFDNPAGWNLSRDSNGAASVSDGKLSLVSSRPSTVRIATASFVTPENFFLTVSAHTEICRPGDAYGIVVRYTSDLEQLRFLLNCDGSASVVSVEQGNGFTLVPRTESFAALPGSRVTNTLSVRSLNDNFTFFINGVEVAQVKETRLRGTSVGAIIRTHESELATILFDDFQVLKLTAAATEATTTPTP
jgi:hypothetical protein